MAKKGKPGSGQYPLRLPNDLRTRLDKAAKDRNVSINAVILERLERSFDIEDRFGGPQAVELIVAIATVMKKTGEHAGFYETGKPTNRGEWLDLPYSFDQAAKAAITILEDHAEPLGKIVVPKPNVGEVVGGDPKETEKRVRWMMENLGPGFASKEIRDREEKK